MSYEQEYLQRLCDDYVFFLAELWEEAGFAKFAPPDQTEDDMARWAAYGLDEHGRHHNLRGVLAPRGIGKTHRITAPMPLWHGLRDPGTICLIPSQSYPVAQKIITLVRDLTERVWFLRHLRPTGDLRDAIARGYFDFGVKPAKGKDASVTAFGFDSQLENARAHIVLPDDIETEGSTRTKEARLRLRKRAAEFVSIATYGKKEIVYVGTYHHEDSLYLALAEQGFTFRSYPLLAPHPQDMILGLAPIIQQRIERGELRPSSARGAFDGDCCFERFDQDYIAQRKAQGRSYFAMQQMLIANLGDETRYPLRLSDLIVMHVNPEVAPVRVVYGTQTNTGSTRIDSLACLGFGDDCFHAPAYIDPEMAPYTGTITFIDPAGRGKDKTAWCSIGHLAGTLFVKSLGGLEGGYDPGTVTRLAHAILDAKTTEVRVEANFGLGMFVEILRPTLAREAEARGVTAPAIEPMHTGPKQKEVRILDALEPATAQHRVVIDHEVARNQDFQHQFTRITRERGALEHEDELDALAGAVLAWQETLGLRADHAAERAREQRMADLVAEIRQGMDLDDTPTWAKPW